MGKMRPPRHGSLQFYPRVRAKKYLHRVNWRPLSSEEIGLMGFIGYKVGMKSAYVKDISSNSLTKGQKIILPVTIIECPLIKILSVRFYKNGIVKSEILNDNLDKELKRKIKLPKQINIKQKLEEIEKQNDFDDVRVIVYSQIKKTTIKKTPDIAEMGLFGNLNEKIEFIKTHLNKEISVKDVIKSKVADIRGITIGKGTQGIIKRFGVSLKAHKSEKGVRTLGSGGPWHPARVTFREPRMGQMGFFSRIAYNAKVIGAYNIKDQNINSSSGFKHYGKISGDYLIIYGSVPGPSKRQLIITPPLRLNKQHKFKHFEFIELR
jgi:large subunit ribosomal protein L3